MAQHSVSKQPFGLQPTSLAKEIREAGKRGDHLNLTEDEVAFYDALETDSAVKALGDHSLVAIANGQRHKVKSFALQRGSNWARHSANDPLQIVRWEHDLARGGVTDAVGCLVDSRVANNLLRGAELRIDCLTHAIILTYSSFIGSMGIYEEILFERRDWSGYRRDYLLSVCGIPVFCPAGA